MSMFEQASRLKLRFSTCVGQLSADDLWDLPLTSARGVSLDDIAIALHERLKEDTISFVDDGQKPNAALQLRFDIAKHVIGVKKTERLAALEAKAKAERKQKLLGVLARKQDAALEDMSVEEIEKLIDETA